MRRSIPWAIASAQRLQTRYWSRYVAVPHLAHQHFVTVKFVGHASAAYLALQLHLSHVSPVNWSETATTSVRVQRSPVERSTSPPVALRQLLQVEQDRVTTALPARPRRGLEIIAADRELVCAEHHQLLEPTRFKTHSTLAVHRILQRSAREHQAHWRSAAAAEACRHAVRPHSASGQSIQTPSRHCGQIHSSYQTWSSASGERSLRRS